MRTDARRNRSAVLEAAGAVFAEQGLDVSLNQIARRAGVGNATLYRHFPTREALVVELFERQMECYLATAEDAATAEDRRLPSGSASPRPVNCRPPIGRWPTCWCLSAGVTAAR